MADFCANCIRDKVLLFPVELEGRVRKLCRKCGGGPPVIEDDTEPLPTEERGLYATGRAVVEAVEELGGHATLPQVRAVLGWEHEDVRRTLYRLSRMGYLRCAKVRHNVHVYELPAVAA